MATANFRGYRWPAMPFFWTNQSTFSFYMVAHILMHLSANDDLGVVSPFLSAGANGREVRKPTHRSRSLTLRSLTPTITTSVYKSFPQRCKAAALGGLAVRCDPESPYEQAHHHTPHPRHEQPALCHAYGESHYTDQDLSGIADQPSLFGYAHPSSQQPCSQEERGGDHRCEKIVGCGVAHVAGVGRVRGHVRHASHR